MCCRKPETALLGSALPACSGVTFPGLQMIISNWVDDDCNSGAISFVYSGVCSYCALATVACITSSTPLKVIQLQVGVCFWLLRQCLLTGATFGAIAAYLSAPFIVESWGWPAVFTVYGLIGFIWVVMWSMLVSERPSHRQVSLLQAKEPDEAPRSIPYRAFATYLPLWAIIIVETSHGELLAAADKS